MTDSPSEANPETAAAGNEIPEDGAGALAVFAAELASVVGAAEWSAEFATVHVSVDRERWREAITAARDAGLPFFSWLSAIDWSRQVSVGESIEKPDEMHERYQVLARLSSVTSGDGALFVADVPKDDPWIDSLVPVFGGAAWHEREAAEMFGIDFRDHPNLVNLYLPDQFEGYPLRKSFPLLSREVKPWPGTVDVEGMPGAVPSDDDAEDVGEEG